MSKFFALETENLSMHYSLDLHPDPADFRMHTHSMFELYCFLGGKGDYYVEGTGYPLHRGDILVLNNTEAHYIALDPDVPYERCAVHFNEKFIEKIDPSLVLLSPFTEREPGKHNLFREQDLRDTACSFYLQNLLKRQSNQELQVLTNLYPLLNELKNCADSLRGSSAPPKETQIYQIISYINSHLDTALSLDLICDQFYISKSQLCRDFKAATGSTVWNYISTKRLLLAKKLIETGNSPTKIFNKCGFSDYSVFYRSYQKFFGHPPKYDTKK